MRTRYGYGLVLLLIVVTYVLGLLAERRWVAMIMLLVQTTTVWHALRVSGARRGPRLAAAVVFVLALTAGTLGLLVQSPWLVGWTFLAAGALYLLAPLSIVRDLGGRQVVDGQTMRGALAAYLLIGMAFGFAYECLALMQPGPLFGQRGDPVISEALFFSFVTMTTTGYGDLVPAGNPAQTLAVLEALIGQLFLVTAVAKVVENWRPRNWRSSRSFAGDDAAAPEGR